MIIGVVAEFYLSDVDDEIARCVWAAIDVLREYGAQVKKISLAGLKDCEYALTIIDTCETSTVHRANLRDRPQDYGDDVRLLLECGELPSAVDYLEAQQIRRHLRAEVQAAFSQVDVVAGPTLPIRRRTIGKETAKINGRDVDALENLIRLVGPASLLGLSRSLQSCANESLSCMAERSSRKAASLMCWPGPLTHTPGLCLTASPTCRRRSSNR